MEEEKAWDMENSKNGNRQGGGIVTAYPAALF